MHFPSMVVILLRLVGAALGVLHNSEFVLQHYQTPGGGAPREMVPLALLGLARSHGFHTVVGA